MSRLLTRLRKLEGQLTGESGLVPHTKRWWDYWNPRIDKMIAGEALDQKTPFEVIDAMIHGAEVALVPAQHTEARRTARRISLL